MKDNNLDNIDKLAKKAFEDFEVPYDPMDWTAFQHQLKDESSIDQVAKNTLEDYQVDLPNHSWEQFETLLSNKNRNYRYIWWLKAAEVSAVALLLLGLAQWFPSPLSSSSTIAYDATTTPSLEHNNTLSPTTHNATAQEQTLAPVDNHSSPLIESTTIAPPPTSSAMNDQDLEGSASSDDLPPQGPAARKAPEHASAPPQPPTVLSSTSSEKHMATKTPLVSAESVNHNNDAVAFNEKAKTTTSVQANTLATAHETTLATASKNQNTRTTSPSTTNAETTTLQDKLTIALLAPATWSNKLPNTEPVVEIRKAIIKIPFQPQHYLGARLGVGANTATSMGNTSIGYSAGLTYERAFTERWSIVTGFEANLKRFNRNDLLEVSDKDGQTYEVNQSKTTHLVVLAVPLDVQYTLFKSDKWRLYLAAGISLNAVASRAYSGTQEIENDGLSFSLDLNSAGFERGLFENGSFLRNAYLSIGGGVGVERQLGNSLSLYLLPTYRQAVTRAGDDYLHTFNVNIGIKSPISVKKR